MHVVSNHNKCSLKVKVNQMTCDELFYHSSVVLEAMLVFYIQYTVA